MTTRCGSGDRGRHRRRAAGRDDGYDEPGAPGRGEAPDADEADAGGHGRRRRRRHHHRHGGRKERVLHTRISEQLADDIRRLADDLRVPASNLVRNVLEEVFTMVESVSEDVGELFEDVLDEAEDARERVRRRAARQRRGERGTPRSRAGTEARARRFDGWVEDELRGDEDVHPGPGAPPDGSAEAEGTGAAPGAPSQSQAANAAEGQPPAFSDVVGWQPLVLNHEGRCAACAIALSRGGEAYVGVGAHGLTASVLCPACAARLR